MNQTRRIGGALFAASLFVVLAPFAEAMDSNATPSPISWVPDAHTGFDWAAMPNDTHVVVDAIHAQNRVDLTGISTPFLDVEVTGLASEEPLQVTDTVDGTAYRDYAYPTGHAIFWHIPAAPGALVLRDPSDGVVLTTVTLTQESVHLQMAGGGGSVQYQPNPPCGSCGRVPQYTGSDPDAQTWVTLNGADSFSSDVTISVTTGWKHTNVFVASGNYGGGLSASGSKNYQWTEGANVFIQSNGAGQVGQILVWVRKDHYDDGSSDVYAVSPARGYGSVGWNWNPTHAGHTYRLQNSQTNGAQGFALTESHSGGVTWSGGWSYGGFTGSAATTSTTDNNAVVTFTFKANDNALHTYTYNVVSGDGAANGMVGYAWKES